MQAGAHIPGDYGRLSVTEAMLLSVERLLATPGRLRPDPAIAARLDADRSAWRDALWGVLIAAGMIGAQPLGRFGTETFAPGPAAVLLLLGLAGALPGGGRGLRLGVIVGVGIAATAMVAWQPALMPWAVVEVAAAGFALAAIVQRRQAERRWALYQLREVLQTEALSQEPHGRSGMELAEFDKLTSAADPCLFDTELAFAWQGDLNGRIAALLIDLDGFAAFNARHGRLAGDSCLASIAATLQQQLRTDIDLLARYGGEEFAVMLPGTDQADAAMVAERIRGAVQALAIPHPDNGPSGVMTVSIGCASLERRDGSPDDLMDAADKALYVAKQAGRNRVEPPLVVSAAVVPVLATARDGTEPGPG